MENGIPDSGPSAFVVERRGTIQIVIFMVDHLIDQGIIQIVGKQLEQLVVKSGQPKMIIDFSNLDHVSSAMLGVLVDLHRTAQKMNGEVRLASLSPSLSNVVKISQLEKLLKIYSTTQDAATDL
ncbi:MAG: hypothetical protein CMJ20_04815 [Phycisphaeraceae bacterium]|nr:hypothetical protein [Phycisphaeraceae bacterium]